MPPGKAGKRENCISYSNAVLVHCLNSTSCLISSMFWLTTPVLTLLYDSLNLVINALSSGLLGGMVQDKRRSWNVLHAQYTSALSSGFSISQGNVEALDRWDGKTKRCLISYFLGNTNSDIFVIGSCMSRLQQVKGGTFFDTQCQKMFFRQSAYGTTRCILSACYSDTARCT